MANARRVGVALTIDRDQCEAIDRIATLRRSSRSQVMRDAVTHYLRSIQRSLDSTDGEGADLESDAA